MSNHTHLVLRINQQEALFLDDMEVIARWHKLYKGTILTRLALKGKVLTNAQSIAVKDTVKVWRQRLSDISWYMRSLNEYIARLANKEDDVTGRFWEGRFKCQALLGDAALAACMAYVDLNPVRANMADSPKSSAHTSIQYRINAARVGKTPKYLECMADKAPVHSSEKLPFTLTWYLQLIDQTSQQILINTENTIVSEQDSLLTRLKINRDQWYELSNSFEDCFEIAAGNEQEMRKYQAQRKLKKLRCQNNAKRLFG